MAESDPTLKVTQGEAFAWFADHPDGGVHEFAQAMAALHRATPAQAKKLETRVRVWRCRAGKKAAAAPPTNLHTLPPPEHDPQAPPDPKTATPIEVATWLTRQAFQAVADGGARTPSYAAILRAAKEAHADLVALQKAGAPESASMTLAEVCAKLEAEVREVPESLLEVAVVEWARRHKLRVAADERGRPTLLSAAG